MNSVRKISLFPSITRKCGSAKVSVRSYTPRRALMYVPGDDLKKINKSVTLDVDCVTLDCEDGVAVNKKEQAREAIRGVLNAGKPTKNRNYDLSVRINSCDTIYWQDDLKACLTAKFLPDSICLPKVESSATIRAFLEETSNYVTSTKKLDLIMYIESAQAFINLVDICKTAAELSKESHFTPAALVFGSDDFCANIGATRTEDSLETLYARQKLVLVAKAFHMQAIDMVYIKYQDFEGLKRQCEQGMRMGFTGKQVIHPGQVAIVQESFVPTQSQIEWAAGLLKSFTEHQNRGKGAFTYKGSMIDMPTMKQAENVIELIKLVKNA
ncbi:citramalyl-CoA lyase, mitochondrial-like [Cylas formicarius]|uniref:citramalyl-CoA lyase, mitochondrial-like n=1 Tax=Cylas formicarius TaxID=197179 RepID=UPI002958B5CE|nr:citramalyl-CoA lyase, mitochondrial-like [Cylas formicarius]